MSIKIFTTLSLVFLFGIANAEDGHNHDHSNHKHEAKTTTKKKSKSVKKKSKKESHNHSGEKHSHESEESHQHDSHSDHGEEHEDHSKKEEHAHSHDELESDKHDSHADHSKKYEESGHDHGHGHDSHGAEAFGEGKAITEVFNEGEKFKLSVESESLLNIKASKIKQTDSTTFIVKSSAIVRYQGKLGVFIKKNGWFKLIEIESATVSTKTWTIRSKQLSENELVVDTGVPLLRVAHLQASGQGGQGHAH